MSLQNIEEVFKKSPFYRHPTISGNVDHFFRMSTLNKVRKMRHMTVAQIQDIVSRMYVGGISMLQGLLLFAHLAAAGTRSPHFTFLRWEDSIIIKDRGSRGGVCILRLALQLRFVCEYRRFI